MRVTLVPTLSRTVIVRLTLPNTAGFPVIRPAEEMVNPVGSVPLQVYGGVPPSAATVCEYAAPVVPPGSVRVLITSATPFTSNENCLLVELPRESVTCTDTE